VSRLFVRNLTVEYASAGYIIRPLDELSLSARGGDLVLLLGPSGCGKTTLLSCLAGILAPTKGLISVDTTDVGKLRGEALTQYRRHTVGIVFQAFNLIPSLTAQENVEAPLAAAGVSYRDAREVARRRLVEVGLEDRTHHRPGDLSGGQQQRVAIARALALDPPLLLADEPTAHLDYIQVEGVLRTLRELASGDRMVVIATHDERMLPLADRVVEMTPRFRAAASPPEKVKLKAGDVLFEQGSRGGRIYVVEDGEIELVRVRETGAEERLATSRRGDYFGELGPLLGFPRAATARARTDAVVTGYTVADFREMFGPDGVAEMLGGRNRPRLRRKTPLAAPRARRAVRAG
jgi:putative ABC transport system ATP-binding protein